MRIGEEKERRTVIPQEEPHETEEPVQEPEREKESEPA